MIKNIELPNSESTYRDGTTKEKIESILKVLTSDEKIVFCIMLAFDYAMTVSDIRRYFIDFLFLCIDPDKNVPLITERAPYKAKNIGEKLIETSNELLADEEKRKKYGEDPFNKKTNLNMKKKQDFIDELTNNVLIKFGVTVPGFSTIKEILNGLLKQKLIIKRKITGKKEKEVYAINPHILLNLEKEKNNTLKTFQSMALERENPSLFKN